MEEVTADVADIVRGLELDVEPEDVTQWLRSHDEAPTDEGLLLADEQRRWCLEMESPGDKEVKIVGMTTRDQEHYVGFERMDPNFERSSAVGKVLSDSIMCCRRIIRERKTPSVRQASLLSYCKRSPRPRPPSATTTLIGQQLLTPRQDPPPAKRPRLPEGSDDGSRFLAVKYFLRCVRCSTYASH